MAWTHFGFEQFNGLSQDNFINFTIIFDIIEVMSTFALTEVFETIDSAVVRWSLNWRYSNEHSAFECHYCTCANVKRWVHPQVTCVREFCVWVFFLSELHKMVEVNWDNSWLKEWSVPLWCDVTHSSRLYNSFVSRKFRSKGDFWRCG